MGSSRDPYVGHQSPEEAALSAFPVAAKAQVLSSKAHDEDTAAVVIDTQPSWPVRVGCVRKRGQWFVESVEDYD